METRWKDGFTDGEEGGMKGARERGGYEAVAFRMSGQLN